MNPSKKEAYVSRLQCLKSVLEQFSQLDRRLGIVSFAKAVTIYGNKLRNPDTIEANLSFEHFLEQGFKSAK